MKYEYNDLLSRKRVRPSTVKRQRSIDDFYSDRSRILYCSSSAGSSRRLRSSPWRPIPASAAA